MATKASLDSNNKNSKTPMPERTEPNPPVNLCNSRSQIKKWARLKWR